MSIYVQSNQIISELRCHRNLLTSSKAAPLCLRQILVVRMSMIQLSDRLTSFFDNIQVFMGHFLYNLPRFSAAVWHTQRMTNFVTIFLWRFFAPVWHSLCGRTNHVTPVLASLHWLPVRDRICFKVCLMVYHSIRGLVPAYIMDMGSENGVLLRVPHVRTSTYGGRAFSSPAPDLWNSLPLAIRSFDSGT